MDRRPLVYADTTALIGLARIDQLDLLTLLRTPVRVTMRVWEEATADPARPGAALLEQARKAELLTVVAEGDEHAYPRLDPGESTALSAAAAAHASVLLDEGPARAFLVADPVLRTAISDYTGIIGLILLAKARGRIPSVKPLLDALIEQRFRIGAALYREVLRRAGEL